MKAFDPDLYVHGFGVARISERIARAMGYPSSFVTFVGEAGLLHDVGKIAIPLELLDNRRPDVGGWKPCGSTRQEL